ncbi:hypothetical protein GQ42DRAFT_27256 [Ramicandelaber brevisporus]|nr:hypothetical protein GQ42DRAFT_27256 [Ramicandelaber brevisporus]
MPLCFCILFSLPFARYLSLSLSCRMIFCVCTESGSTDQARKIYRRKIPVAAGIAPKVQGLASCYNHCPFSFFLLAQTTITSTQRLPQTNKPAHQQEETAAA